MTPGGDWGFGQKKADGKGRGKRQNSPSNIDPLSNPLLGCKSMGVLDCRRKSCWFLTRSPPHLRPSGIPMAPCWYTGRSDHGHRVETGIAHHTIHNLAPGVPPIPSRPLPPPPPNRTDPVLPVAVVAPLPRPILTFSDFLKAAGTPPSGGEGVQPSSLGAKPQLFFAASPLSTSI